MLASAMAGLAGVGSLSIADENGIITHSTIPGAGRAVARRSVVCRASFPADGARGLAADTPFRGLQRTMADPVRPQAAVAGRQIRRRRRRDARTRAAARVLPRRRCRARRHDLGAASGRLCAVPRARAAERDRRARARQSAARPAARTSSSGLLRAAFEPGGPTYLNAYRCGRQSAAAARGVAVGKRDLAALVAAGGRRVHHRGRFPDSAAVRLAHDHARDPGARRGRPAQRRAGGGARHRDEASAPKPTRRCARTRRSSSRSCTTRR